MTYHVIYNPLSANGNGEEKARSLEKIYENTVYHNVTEINDYREFFAGLPEEDGIVLCGGDGTLNCFVNNTDGMEINREILYFAAGTGNDFLHDIGVDPGSDPISVNQYIKDLPRIRCQKSRCSDDHIVDNRHNRDPGWRLPHPNEKNSG